ncbi:hypothetical protein Tco_0083722, partial [Tanacetum coccineum]
MTLRKLVYEESKEENSDSSGTKDISERLSNESFDMSQTREEKKPNLREKDPDEGRLARTPRVKEYHKKAKLPSNVKVYEGSKDPEDHLGSFLAVAEQEEWLMPVWCMMFRQTLSGAVRNWFDYKDPKSTNSIKELSQKFLKEFLQQKRYAKDPMEIHGIKRRMNEGGILSEIMYGHCFKSFGADVKSRLRKAIAPLVGFSGYVPLPGNGRGAWVSHVIPIQVLLIAPQGTQPSADVRKRQRKDKIPYRGGNLDAAEISGWTIEATESFQKIKRRLAKLSMLAVPKEGELAIVDDRNLLHSDREGGPNISPYDKVLEDNFAKAQSQSRNRCPMEEMLKLSGTKGRLAKWVAELRTYHVSYVQRKEAEGQ